MNLNYNSKEFSWQRFFWHILFWTAYTIFIATVYGNFERNYGQRFIEILIQLPLRITTTYFTVYILVMRILLKKKYALFTIIFIFSTVVLSILQRFTYFNFTFPLYYPEYLDKPLFYWPAIFIGIIKLYTITFALLSVKFLKQWYENQGVKHALESQKAQAELKLLKAQIHPHFLFNTLNNLYALTLKKSEKAPEVVLKLSHLLNYILYECNANYVSLTKEIEMLKNYIELEKIRYGDRLKIEFDIVGDTSGIMIAPLILLPFLENSFKHGTSVNLDNPWINIIFQITENEIIFQIENSKDKDEIKQHSYQEGIGLQNVKRRLEFLHPEKYELNIESKKSSFFVLFTLKLPSEI